MERKCKSNFNHLPAVLGPWAPTGVTRSGRIVGPERANSAAGVFATVPGCGNLHSSGGRERVHSATRAPRRGPWNVPRLRAASRGALGRGCRAQWKSSTGVDPPHPPSPERTGGGQAGDGRARPGGVTCSRIPGGDLKGLGSGSASFPLLSP